MNDEAAAKTGVLALCIYQEMGETFVQAVAPNATGGSGELTLGGVQVQLDVLAGDPRVNPAWEEQIKNADGLLLLVRFMDVISMDKVKAIYRSIPTSPAPPLSVVLFREEGESDFKMSCAACGQKLWVRDQDVGKRGRCPNCKRAFRLPAQDEHLKAQLLVPDAVSVVTVDRGNPDSCMQAMSGLLERLTGTLTGAEDSFDPNVLKQTTMRIQVSTGDTKPGDEG
jgi:hypothetical protein